MPYTAEQIGPIEVRPFTMSTRQRCAMVLIQRSDTPPHDESPVTVIAPCPWQDGRQRTLEMLSRGVDLRDIRFAQVRRSYEGDGAAAWEGRPLRSAVEILWWTTDDDDRASKLGLATRDYAAQLLTARARRRRA
jgi:hypothetical protein